MNYFELLSNEKEYVNRLTDDERRIYTADTRQLNAISTWNAPTVQEYVKVSRLLNELHRVHRRYNDITEYLYEQPNATKDQQDRYDRTNEINEDLFTVSLTIGTSSAVFNLMVMDECDALYRYLSTMKLGRFYEMCETFDTAVLIETLVLHDCY